jgi:hypothetical protein
VPWIAFLLPCQDKTDGFGILITIKGPDGRCESDPRRPPRGEAGRRAFLAKHADPEERREHMRRLSRRAAEARAQRAQKRRAALGAES